MMKQHQTSNKDRRTDSMSLFVRRCILPPTIKEPKREQRPTTPVNILESTTRSHCHHGPWQNKSSLQVRRWRSNGSRLDVSWVVFCEMASLSNEIDALLDLSTRTTLLLLLFVDTHANDIHDNRPWIPPPPPPPLSLQPWRR